jgi:hypothetical protein
MEDSDSSEKAVAAAWDNRARMAQGIAGLEYLEHLPEVDGWLSTSGAKAICLIGEAQRRLGVTGDIFEIGVHHGKSAILLSHLLNSATERLRVNDLFADQEANRSGSGRGSLEKFRANMERFRPGFQALEVHGGESARLTTRETGTNCRLFHVDGGHSAEETESDLRCAARATKADGMILLDDYFNPEFPAVAEGAHRFLFAERDWAPVVIAFNKVGFVRRDRAAAYLEALTDRASLDPLRLGLCAVHFHGCDALRLFAYPEPGDFRADIRLPAGPVSCRPGEAVTIRIDVGNVGALDILDDPENDVRLDYNIFRETAHLGDGGQRLRLAPLPHGERRAYDYALTAPSEPGHYRLAFDGVLENVAWLGNLGGRVSVLELHAGATSQADV